MRRPAGALCARAAAACLQQAARLPSPLLPSSTRRPTEELRRHATLVVETAAERVADTDSGVRAALRDLLRGTLLPALGPRALAPFVPLLMAHTCAAMTHLAEPVR